MTRPKAAQATAIKPLPQTSAAAMARTRRALHALELMYGYYTAE